MGVFEKNGVCLAVGGYEQDYLEFLDGPFGACQLVMRAAGTRDDVAAGNMRYAFESAATIELGGREPELREIVNEDRLLEEVGAYRKRTGRRWPPLYRVRIVVSATDLGDVEAELWWRALVTRNMRAAEAP